MDDGTSSALDDLPLPSALEQGVIDHQERIIGYLVVLGANREQTEEVIQELAVSAAGARGIQPASVIAWLLSTARCRFIDLLRRSSVRHRRELPVAELDAALADVLTEPSEDDDDDPTRENLSALNRCLARLAPRARELIRLRYWDDLPSSDIAARLGWTDAAVRVGLSKARRALDTCLRRPPSAIGESPATETHDAP